MDSTTKIRVGNFIFLILAYILGLESVEFKVFGGFRDNFWDFSSKKWFLAVSTCPNLSKTIKNGFYIENYSRKLYFLDFLAYSEGLEIDQI